MNQVSWEGQPALRHTRLKSLLSREELWGKLQLFIKIQLEGLPAAHAKAALKAIPFLALDSITSSSNSEPLGLGTIAYEPKQHLYYTDAIPLLGDLIGPFLCYLLSEGEVTTEHVL